MPAVFLVVETGGDGIAGEDLEGQRSDELRGIPGHDDMDVVVALAELTGEIRRFVGRDGAGNAEENGGQNGSSIASESWSPSTLRFAAFRVEDGGESGKVIFPSPVTMV